MKGATTSGEGLRVEAIGEGYRIREEGRPMHKKIKAY